VAYWLDQLNKEFIVSQEVFIQSKNLLTNDPDWWRGAVIYQIYPRSFQDSNGNGIGDLKGITQRLPYVASLGVDAIWISPFFNSPMKDFGYDVSDYEAVDPMFGALSDFDDLIAKANELGIKILIDLVFSHTSDQHPWFTESRSSRENDKSNWYVWADAKPDGSPPNNWLSIFGGSSWQWDTERCQYYLHNFLDSQPDLNFHEPAVQEALLQVAKFWLERGVSGFRLDTINFYVHDQLLRDNPALPPEKRNTTVAPAVNPYNYQEHLYDKNRPENLAFLRRFRELLNLYGAAAVGEVGDAQRGLEIMGEYTSGGDKVQMCYAFEFLSGDAPGAEGIATVLRKLEEVAPEGWACWAFSNHDVVRHSTRWDLSSDSVRLYLTLLMCLRGSVYLYQSEELGLPEANIEFEELQDPYGIKFWPKFKGRDGCRTPMVWSSSNPQGGFSTDKPWLPVPNEHLELSVESQEYDDSLLNFYRRIIQFRKNHPALVFGELTDLKVQDETLSFIRKNNGETIFCAFNFSSQASRLEIPFAEGLTIDSSVSTEQSEQDGLITLGPWQAYLAIKK